MRIGKMSLVVIGAGMMLLTAGCAGMTAVNGFPVPLGGMLVADISSGAMVFSAAGRWAG